MKLISKFFRVQIKYEDIKIVSLGMYDNVKEGWVLLAVRRVTGRIKTKKTLYYEGYHFILPFNIVDWDKVWYDKKIYNFYYSCSTGRKVVYR